VCQYGSRRSCFNNNKGDRFIVHSVRRALCLSCVKLANTCITADCACTWIGFSLCLQVGYDSRTRYNYVSVHHNDMQRGSNVGIPGRWVFPAIMYPGNKFISDFSYATSSQFSVRKTLNKCECTIEIRDLCNALPHSHRTDAKFSFTRWPHSSA